jgi:hypothetical protein
LKRVILCLDGTWNNDAAPATRTNVFKLHHAIAKTDDKGIPQDSQYIVGIASTQGETAQFLKGAVGYGIAERIKEAYEQLVESYAAGDEIFLFGFSRGAFEARSLAGFITLFGVAKAKGAFAFDTAWSLYRTPPRRRKEALLAELRSASHYPVRIKCIGVWDTVGNIGNPFFSDGFIGRMFKFHDMRLADSTDVALHALAIDEMRGPFRPSLWSMPKGQTLPEHQHVEQVWFPGSHCDVGGGFRETALSDVALLWMAERVTATTGLVFDKDVLAGLVRPDPLGAQHLSATGSIFRWSRIFPFIRLVKQAVTAIPLLRRMLIGTWRSGKLPRGQVAINERLHDSVVQRYGQRVIELRDGRSHMITYRPSNLLPVAPEPRAPAATPVTEKPRRVKVFTVHGTFDHDAGWDNWIPQDNKNNTPQAFINRLSEQLRKRGVMLDELDHTQYNWSGGNSHEERRTAAIGLKKAIEGELSEQYARHGRDYYDAVYIIGHSHGGTISRLAMNLWDKTHDYYDPVLNKEVDEFKHDDQCPTCMRARNGKVGPSTVPRPDGVITFGSPFVTFEKRQWGLLTAYIGAWVFRALSLIPLAMLYAAYKWDLLVALAFFPLPGPVQLGLVLGLPLALYWVVASYLPRSMLGLVERWFGKGRGLFALAAFFQALKYTALAVLAFYYCAYAIGGWAKALQWLPFLGNATFLDWVGFSVPFIVFWLLAVTLPGRLLGWVRRQVVELKEKLPKKYDPAEDRPVPYLSYLTLGDEARLHLRAFGFITWLVQTLGLATVSVMAFAILLVPLIAVEVLTYFSEGGSLLGRVGLSPLSSERALQDRFITVMDWMTFLPSLFWSGLMGYSAQLNLGSVAHNHAVVGFMPGALLAAILIMFMLLMPLVLILLGIAYLVSLRLRGSGLVFGSEKFAWTMANHIAITPHANQNTSMRRIFLAVDAWWRRDYAHCYYYKSDRVIEDVASYISDWSKHAPTPVWPIGAWTAVVGRWAVVLLSVLSMFAVSVPIADAFARWSGSKPASAEAPALEAKPEPTLIEGEMASCWSEAHTVIVQSPEQPEAKARSQWQSEVTQKYGAEFADMENAGSRSLMCGPASCQISYQPCKPRPIDCKDTPHAVEITFELPPELDAEMRSNMASSVVSTLKDRWEAEVKSKFGPEWADTWFNFQTMRERRPVEEGCKEEDLGVGRTQHHCKVAAIACRKPPPLPSQ